MDRIREKVRSQSEYCFRPLPTLYCQKERARVCFSCGRRVQRAFDNSFIYAETDDQRRAIEEVKKDMDAKNIMDRIICGDSGYGKTEVALRAACKAVISGKQVVVLAPTTVLALQHVLTFKERFADFPVRVEMLSRMLTPSEQRRGWKM